MGNTKEKKRYIFKGSNAIAPAVSKVRWGKRINKKYPGCAGKGGATTNFVIPEWMFDRELEEYMNGGVVNA